MSKMKLVLVFALLFANCEARRCCANDAMIASNGSCTDGESIARKINCPHGAYVADQEDDKFFIDGDGRLNFTELGEGMINSEEFCVGEMESNNRTVAVICFDESSGLETEWHIVVRIVCCFVSIVCLLLTLIVYLVLPKLRDLQGRCLMLSIFSLMMSFLFLGTVQLANTYTITMCITLAFSIYFWFTCAFTWLNVVSINMMLSVINPKWFTEFKDIFLVYNLYGWGLPIMMLFVTYITHHTPGEHMQPRFGESRCWFHGDKETWVFFYGPISVLLISNLIMFVVTIWVLVKNEKLFAATKLKSHKFKCMLYMKLFFIMGVLWLFEPLSAIPAISDWKLWIVTDSLNSLQGILIFLLLVVFRNRVRRDLARMGITCCHFMDSWTAIKEGDCEELDEEKNDVAVSNINSLT